MASIHYCPMTMFGNCTVFVLGQAYIFCPRTIFGRCTVFVLEQFMASIHFLS